jgi:hypothetical protein
MSKKMFGSFEGELDYIFPHKEICMGFENGSKLVYFDNSASLELIISLMYGIENGCDIPAVPMYKELQYFPNTNSLCDVYSLFYYSPLSSGIVDGGHHRVLTHKLMKKELKIMLYPEQISDLGQPIPDDRMCSFDSMIIDSNLDKFSSVHRSKSDYMIPQELINMKKRPSLDEINSVLNEYKNKPLSSKILLELYK